MSATNQLQYCRICINRKMDATFGLLCGLSGEKPDLNSDCVKFQMDEDEARIMAEREKAIEETNDESFFSLEKKGIRKGVAGGILMMAIALVWFIAGWSAGYIFYYPPILFVIGLFALVKGIFNRNLSGKNPAG